MKSRFLIIPCALAAFAALAHGDTVILKDGRIIKGKVVDNGKTIFIEHARFGGITVDRENVVRLEIDKAPKKAARDFDEVVLKSGAVIRGDIKLSPDGSEVIVELGERGSVRQPRTAVDHFVWRDGREETLSQSDDPDSTQLRSKIDRLVGDLVKLDPRGQPDLVAQGTARRELMELGVFARAYLEQTSTNKQQVQEILHSLDRLEEVRRVLPAEAEKKDPRIAEKLINDDPDTRKGALHILVAEVPHLIGPLLLRMAKSDKSPQVRAFAVSQLSALRKFDELASVLRVTDGPLRLAAAFALGNAGIYAGVPILIEALRLNDVQIRAAAAHKLKEYTKQHFGFRAKAPKEEREKAIAKWNTWWNENGRDLVVRGIKEVAPSMKGAETTAKERAQARELWTEAAKVVSKFQPGLADQAEGKDVLRRAKLERALSQLRKALDLDPSLSSARMTRAVLLYEEFERVDEARNELYRILDRAEFDPGNPDAARKFAQFHLGAIALRERTFRKATLAFGQALQYDESFLDAQIGQADAYLGLALSDRPGEALKSAKRIEALASARIAFDRALTTIASRKRDLLKLIENLEDKSIKSLEEGQVVQAVRRSRRSLQSRKAALHFRVARLESARQRDDAALEHYRIAANLEPDNKEFADARTFWEGIRRTAKEKEVARQNPKQPQATPEK